MSPRSTLNSCGSSSRLRRPQEAADPGDPGIVAVHLEQRAIALVGRPQRGQLRFGVDAHRAELDHPELVASTSDALLREEHRATVLELDTSAVNSAITGDSTMSMAAATGRRSRA